MKVFKFGGTSLANATRINRAIALAKAQIADGIVLVTSAVAGVTDMLQKLADTAGDGDTEQAEGLIRRVESLHHALAVELLGSGSPELEHCGREIELPLVELNQIASGLRLLRFSTPRATASILGFGERLATLIIAARSSRAGGGTGLPRCDRGRRHYHFLAEAVPITLRPCSAPHWPPLR